MLSSLFGKKPDHPMSDLKSAQALISALPKDDAHRMLSELTDWVESVGGNYEFRIDHQFAVLGLLDQAAQPCVHKLTREYFASQEPGKLQENRLWLALGNWWYHLAAAYLAVFDRCCEDMAGGAKVGMPLLAARTAHALGKYLKFVSTHYGPMDPQFWHKVARLYRHAENGRYLDERLALYPGSADAVSSVKDELAVLMAWFGCGLDNLRPLLIHLTDCIVRQYRDAIAIDARQDGGSLFCFYLDAPAAPLRIKVGAQAGPSARFISLAALMPRLEEVFAQLEKGHVPPELNLGGTYEAAPVSEAVRFLLDYLRSPPLRRSPRRSIRVNLNVANGLAGILRCVDPEASVKSDQLLPWEVEDISATGFRTVSSMRLADGVRIGSLFGFKPEGVPQWGVAVVRRLTCDASHRMHVGAEKLGGQAGVVTLRQEAGAADGMPALWLRSWPNEVAGEARLIMRAEAFRMQQSLRAILDGREYLLLPLALEERGVDYDLARFRRVEQQV